MAIQCLNYNFYSKQLQKVLVTISWNFFRRFLTKKPEKRFMGAASFNNDEKLVHPKLQANYLSHLFFCWTFPSLIKGFRRGFKEEDLFDPLPYHKSSTLGQKLEEKWLSETQSRKKPALWRPIFRMFFAEFLFAGIIIFIKEFIVQLAQPILIWKLITTHLDNNKYNKEHEAYIYAFLLVISSFAKVIMFNWCIINLRELAMKVRIACSSLIYRKSLKLDKNSLNKTATGRIVNLLSNDLNRFDTLFLQLHYLWAAPLQTVIIVYFLYLLLDPSATVGVAVFCLFIPIQIFMGKKYSEFRLKTARKTDQRVSLINEIISGIQVIKMYTWEKLFIKFTSTIRKQEIRYIRGTAYLKATQDAFNKFISKGALFLCIILYVLAGNHLQPQYVFVIKSFYNLLKQSMTSDFPEAIKNIAEAAISFKRIEEFLLSKEIEINNKRLKEKIGVYLNKASAKWSTSTCQTLSEISFKAAKKQLVTVVGPVGSGKTSLINVMLQELPLQEGYLSVEGKISYACQEPWLFAGTIKENILFGQPLDIARYNQVIKACALDHDLQIMSDNSVIGDRGTTLSGGQKARISLARAVYKKADIYILDDPLSAVDASVGKQLFEQCILGYLKDKCVILATHQLQYLKKSDWIYFLKNGKVACEGDFERIRNCGEDFAKLLKKEVEFENSSSYDRERNMNGEKGEEKFNESKNFGTISWKVYKQYLLSEGWFLSSIVTVLFLLSQSIQSGTDYFESYWVNLEEKNNKTEERHSLFSSDDFLYFYSAFMFLILVLSIITSISFYTYFLKISTKLHEVMFSAVVKAKLSFFYKNSTGAILNRFSKDMEAADSKVPKYLIDTIQNGLQVFSIFLLIAIVNPWMLINSAVLLILFYCIRRFYLSTSRELKRIEAIRRSPVYSHLNETLLGLETIRAFEIQEKLKQRFDEILNRNTSAFHLFIVLASTFGLWLSLLSSTYVAVVTVSCFWGSKIYGGNLGLMITQAISLAELLQWGMIQWSEFENEMTSIERIIQYKDTESEEEDRKETTWPDSSSVEFKGVTLKYKEESLPALNCLDFCVAPKEKIGIVGRTGAGKTSIISALFRLVQFEGQVLVGGVNTKNIPLETVRSHISIIPQEPVLFSGTVRENLDPFNQVSDSDLWTILDDLDLKHFVNVLPAGLDSVIHEKGANLSVGQRQLFCLARALLRKNKILVLDEATANVDYKMDSLIQTTIKKKLRDCTVLIIAHRLNTIMDCDKVLVMDGGKVLEFDHPHKLLQNEGALFQLVSQTGPSMTMHLKNIAEKSYRKRYENTKL